MNVSLVVPFTTDGAERERNWTWLRSRYQELYPDWEIVVGGCTGRWSKGAAVNAAAAQAHGDVLIVIDADVLVGAEVLPAAVAELERAPWVIPHGLVYRLTEVATQALLADRITAAPGRIPRSRLVRPARQGPPGGGAVVASREGLAAAGGIDERFEGWGGEDISLARALDTIVGPHTRLGQAMWHLHHEPMPRRPRGRASPENEQLAGRYLDATGDPVAMSQLCDRRPYEGKTGGGIVVAREEVIRSVPLDARFVGWG